MAIKDKKIPSPSSIKSSPTSFSQQEIKEIRDLKTEVNNLIFLLGQLYFDKMKLKDQETVLKSQLKDLEKKEINIAKKLSSKYGKGSIDLETGTFTPIN